MLKINFMAENCEESSKKCKIIIYEKKNGGFLGILLPLLNYSCNYNIYKPKSIQKSLFINHCSELCCKKDTEKIQSFSELSKYVLVDWLVDIFQISRSLVIPHHVNDNS